METTRKLLRTAIRKSELYKLADNYLWDRHGKDSLNPALPIRKIRNKLVTQLIKAIENET